MALPAPRAIIFDWDNTLVNTWPIIHAALNATFADTGKPLWTMDDTRARVRKSMRDAFPEIFGERWEEVGQLYQKHYRARHLTDLQPLENSEALLRHIRNKGLHCVVVSNKKGPNLRTEVEHLGWSHYFDNLVGADDAPRDKPHADPVHMAFEASHITPGSDVWFIGDSDIDLECALNTGCTAILYGELAKDHPEFTDTHFLGQPYHAHVYGHDEIIRLLG